MNALKRSIIFPRPIFVSCHKQQQKASPGSGNKGIWGFRASSVSWAAKLCLLSPAVKNHRLPRNSWLMLFTGGNGFHLWQLRHEVRGGSFVTLSRCHLPPRSLVASGCGEASLKYPGLRFHSAHSSPKGILTTSFSQGHQ